MPSRGAPASFAQQRLWFLAQLDPASAYVNSAALQLRGSLDVGALERSVQEIVRRHEVLRTVLLTCEARPGQAERIARAMVGVQSMSDENVRLTLERVRRESHG